MLGCTNLEAACARQELGASAHVAVHINGIVDCTFQIFDERCGGSAEYNSCNVSFLFCCLNTDNSVLSDVSGLDLGGLPDFIVVRDLQFGLHCSF